MVLVLPPMLVTAPFVLTFEAIPERMQLEPPPDLMELGQRGALRSAPQKGRQDGRWQDLQRVSPDSLAWQCRVCTARFRQDRRLMRLSP